MKFSDNFDRFKTKSDLKDSSYDSWKVGQQKLATKPVKQSFVSLEKCEVRKFTYIPQDYYKPKVTDFVDEKAENTKSNVSKQTTRFAECKSERLSFKDSRRQRLLEDMRRQKALTASQTCTDSDYDTFSLMSERKFNSTTNPHKSFCESKFCKRSAETFRNLFNDVII